jgi:hypothetical protein
MSPMKVRTLFGRQSWLMYEVRIQKPLRTGVEALGKSTARRGAAKRLRRRICSTRNLLVVSTRHAQHRRLDVERRWFVNLHIKRNLLPICDLPAMFSPISAIIHVEEALAYAGISFELLQ